jgi:hypothetical protein
MTLSRRLLPIAVVSGVAAILLSACAGAISQSVLLTDQTVTPITNGTAAPGWAAALGEARQRAGFTREEILQEGPQVGDALATSGGAQVRRGKIVSALFAVQDGQLIVTSRERGTFVLPLTGSGTAQ